MKKLSCTLFLFAFAITLFAQQPTMVKIFNGKDLTGWKAPANNIWWKAKRGCLCAQSSPEKTGSILWTVKQYQDFVFQTDFKMGGGVVDSGVFLRSENDQIQIGISGSLKRDMTASPYIPDLRYPVEAKGVKELLKPEGWNTLKIKAVGNTYTVWLNGVEVMRYTSEKMPAAGPIGLQLHPGNEMSICFRKVRVGVI
ncbi:MAG: DUF1080 domain-containing protein [Bacteroidetes bacterium]|nr:DUF1080 domain-containing protein [Bacteroidota bacterium]